MINKFKTEILKFKEKYKNSDKIFKASIWFIMVTIIDKAIGILSEPIVNRIMTISEIGIYNVYNTWKGILTVLITMNLFCGVLEVYITKNKEKTNYIVCSLMNLSVIISLVFLLLLTIFNDPISKLASLKTSYLFIMYFSIISTAIIQFWCVPKKFNYCYTSYSFLMIGLFIFKYILSIALIILMPNDRVLGRILGLMIPEIICAMVIYFIIMKNANCKIQIRYWKKAILYNLPLLPHYLSTILLSSSDKIMIQHMSGDAQVGLYSIAYSYSSLSLIVFSAINNSYTPFSFECIKNYDYDNLKNKTIKIIKAIIIIALLLILVSPVGLYILAGKKYFAVLDIIPILIFGIFLSVFYFIYSNVEFYHEKTKYIFPITILGSAINILLNIIMIPKFGFKVAAYTTAIGYLLITLLHYYLARKIVKEDIFSSGKIFKYVLMFGLTCILISFVFKGIFL